MTNLIDVDVTGLLRASGAINTVYLVPAEERDDSDVPLLCVCGAIGSGTPERAYHRRWRYLGKLAADAVPDSVSKALRGCKDAIVAIAELYEGHAWDGNNHVGRWREDEHVEPNLHEIEQALSQVATYWAACDYFAPLGTVDQRMRELATCDNVDDVVEREMKNTGYDGVYLDESDVRRELQSDARIWLDRHEDAASDQERVLRARLEGWLRQ